MKINSFPLLLIALSLLHLDLSAQRSEFFVEVDAENESFEVISGIEGVQVVALMAPALSEDLGQFTFFQALPTKAAITVDVDNGDVLYNVPLEGLLETVYPSHLRRVNDGRVFGLISYFTEVQVVAFDPAVGGEPEIIASVFPGNLGNISLYVTGYNPLTNRFYLQYSYDTNDQVSWMIEVDVETGEILSDFMCSPGLNDLFWNASTNSFLGMYTEGEFNMAFRKLGWFDPSDGSIEPITNNAVQIQFYSANLSSLDEANEKIYISRYTGFPGSQVEVVSYGGGVMESNLYLVLESDYASVFDVPIGFLADTSQNILNVHFSNSRDQLYGLHWGDQPIVQVANSDVATMWDFAFDASNKRVRISGLSINVPKQIQIFDSQGRLMYTRENLYGVEVEYQFDSPQGVYFVALTEGTVHRTFKVMVH